MFNVNQIVKKELNEIKINYANKAIIYCDGAISDNVHRENNKGGWCAIIKYKGEEYIVTGTSTSQTNNRMELLPLVKCLPTLIENGIGDITIISDSRYVLNGFRCRKSRMKLKKKNKLANDDLWTFIYKLLDEYRPKITAQWVRGHSGVVDNERCDKIANSLALSPI